MPKLPFEDNQSFSSDREFEPELPLRAEPDVPSDDEPQPPHDREPARRPVLIWPEDDTPPTRGRARRGAFLVALVMLALGAVWVVAGYIIGPTTSETEQATANEPEGVPAGDNIGAPASVDKPTSRDLPDTPSEPVDPQPVVPPASSPEPAPLQPSLERSAPSSKAAPPSKAAVPPSTAPTERPTPPAPAEAESRKPSPAPERRLNIEPPARPPYRSIPEPATPRPAIVDSTSSQPVASPPSPPQSATTAQPGPLAASAAPRPATDAEISEIRAALGRYRSAFSALDAGAAHQVWPTVSRQTLDRAFGQLKEQNLSFDACAITVKGVVAGADCTGTARSVPKVGNGLAQTRRREWSFSLRKASEGGWLIQHVEAR